MTSKGCRGVFLSIYKFDAHIDWSRFRMKNIEIDLSKKGELDRSGRKNWTNNCVNLRYLGNLPDRYDDRINLIIDAIGGQSVLRELLRSHKPETVFILLEIPAKSSCQNEEGYISHDTLSFLVELGIELHFWYV